LIEHKWFSIKQGILTLEPQCAVAIHKSDKKEVNYVYIMRKFITKIGRGWERKNS